MIQLSRYGYGFSALCACESAVARELNPSFTALRGDIACALDPIEAFSASAAEGEEL